MHSFCNQDHLSFQILIFPPTQCFILIKKNDFQLSYEENSPIGEPARRRQRRSCTDTVSLKIATYARTSPALPFYAFLTVREKATIYFW